jgi:hypothetical protein
MQPDHSPSKGKQAWRRLIPAKVTQSYLHRQIFQKFANKVGLVYFGYVDQRNDEHSLIRGLTVSTKHRDNHYCIGTYEGYDTALVERVDTIQFPAKPSQTHTWIIMTFDLHHAIDLPHVFLGLRNHGEAFYAQLFTKYAHFSELNTSLLPEYDPSFAARYIMLAKADHILQAKQVFNPAITKVLVDEFQSLAIEINNDTLYVYSDQHRPTAALLEKMLTRGLWLARAIDQAHTHADQ